MEIGILNHSKKLLTENRHRTLFVQDTLPTPTYINTKEQRVFITDIETPGVRANSKTLSLTSAQTIEVSIDVLTCYAKPPISRSSVITKDRMILYDT